MGNIRVLDKETINKIAAGEVIERPASVVKELVENSIDAGATIITCEIKDGGKSLIRITDNGCGFLKDDIKVAFLRHATSKIKDENDLNSIKSLGFRGEALSSISAVSKLEMLTKRKEDFLGNRIDLEGSTEVSFSEAGCPDGTTFIIRDLFFNTPARQKFLKSNTTEAGYISDLINRLAVSHPQIAFRFINQGKTVLFTNGNGNEKDALYSIYGREVANNLIPVNYEDDTLKVYGFIGKPAILRGNRIYENYYINGRYSKANIITGAIEEAYKGYAMQHKYPFTSLHFEFPLDKLDINVHPTKMEIRIAEGDIYFNKIYSIVKKAIENSNMIVAASLDNNKEIYNRQKEEKLAAISEKTIIPQQFEINRNNSVVKQNVSSSNIISASYKTTDAQVIDIKEDSNYTSNNNTKSELSSEKNIKNDIHEISFHKKPIDNFVENRIEKDISLNEKVNLASDSEKTEVNTSASKEDTKEAEVSTSASKIDFNKLEANTNASKTDIKETKFEQLSFASTKEEFVKSFEEERFTIIGQVFNTYWIVQKDDNMFMIDQHAAHEKVLYERTMKRYRAMQMASQQLYPPIIVTLSLLEEETLLKHMESFKKLGFDIEPFGGKEYSITAVPTDLFKFSGEEFFHDLLDNLINSPVKGDMESVSDRIASMSCKAAIKGNMSMSSLEAHSLIKELLALDNPYHCPHGRPVIICLTKTEIEKKFKRIL